MNKQLSEKEKLLSMLKEIYEQLEELESVLDASFSDKRISLKKEEQDKIKASEQKLVALDQTIKRIDFISNEGVLVANRSLQLEMGF
jgi:hypothetical protein